MSDRPNPHDLQVGAPLTCHTSPCILCSGAGRLSPGRCAVHRPRQSSHLMIGDWVPLSRSACRSQATPVLASYARGLGASLQVGVLLTGHASLRILCSGAGRLSPGRRATHRPRQSSHLMLGGWAPLSRSACRSQATPVLASYARGLGTSLQVGVRLTGHASPHILCRRQNQPLVYDAQELGAETNPP
jgi:hypothetical protein